MSAEHVGVVIKGEMIVSAEFLHNLLQQRAELLEALKEMQIDLKILQCNVIGAEKTEVRWEGMSEVIAEWVIRNDSAITKAEATQ